MFVFFHAATSIEVRANLKPFLTQRFEAIKKTKAAAAAKDAAAAKAAAVAVSCGGNAGKSKGKPSRPAPTSIGVAKVMPEPYNKKRKLPPGEKIAMDKMQSLQDRGLIAPAPKCRPTTSAKASALAPMAFGLEAFNSSKLPIKVPIKLSISRLPCPQAARRPPQAPGIPAQRAQLLTVGKCLFCML